MAKELTIKNLWEEYASGKQTYAQLSNKYQCSTRTIQRHLDKIQVSKSEHQHGEVEVLMDTIYFGRKNSIIFVHYS